MLFVQYSYPQRFKHTIALVSSTPIKHLVK